MCVYMENTNFDPLPLPAADAYRAACAAWWQRAADAPGGARGVARRLASRSHEPGDHSAGVMVRARAEQMKVWRPPWANAVSRQIEIDCHNS